MVEGRPSDARRKHLNDQITTPLVSNFFPIERYYNAADKVYQSFLQCRGSKNLLDDAYVYGKRYCKFIIDALPEHNYYTAKRYEAQRLKHTKQVQTVLSLLEKVADRMDMEEAENQRIFLEQQEQRYRELQQRAQKFTVTLPISSASATDVQESALNKLKLLAGPAKEEEEKKESTSHYRVPSDTEDEDAPLPPPMLPPPPPTSTEDAAPPSYYQALSGRTQFLGPAAADEEEPILRPPTTRRQPPKQRQLPMFKLCQEYRKQYHALQQQQRIIVGGLSTYQGRVSASTNGCTVISALVASNHLTTHGGITDASVCRVIDQECGPLLREIRGKLGLGGHALIIPSDVHDHLVDKKLLKQEYFEGAAGGNIMDADHMGEFVKLLTAGDDSKSGHRKAAATLFFREHVVSLVKFPISLTEAYYDLVDSLPHGSGGATRTRCTDAEALQTLLQYYASSKLSEANCTYIDKNPWDDSLADFDCRVFQGFVWHEK